MNLWHWNHFNSIQLLRKVDTMSNQLSIVSIFDEKHEFFEQNVRRKKRKVEKLLKELLLSLFLDKKSDKTNIENQLRNWSMPNFYWQCIHFFCSIFLVVNKKNVFFCVLFVRVCFFFSSLFYSSFEQFWQTFSILMLAFSVPKW